MPLQIRYSFQAKKKTRTLRRLGGCEQCPGVGLNLARATGPCHRGLQSRIPGLVNPSRYGVHSVCATPRDHTMPRCPMRRPRCYGARTAAITASITTLTMPSTASSNGLTYSPRPMRFAAVSTVPADAIALANQMTTRAAATAIVVAATICLHRRLAVLAHRNTVLKPRNSTSCRRSRTLNTTHLLGARRCAVAVGRPYRLRHRPTE